MIPTVDETALDREELLRNMLNALADEQRRVIEKLDTVLGMLQAHGLDSYVRFAATTTWQQQVDSTIKDNHEKMVRLLRRTIHKRGKK